MQERTASRGVMHDAAVTTAYVTPPQCFPRTGCWGSLSWSLFSLMFAEALNHPSSPRLLQGDGNIRYYEIGSEKPYLSYLMEFRSPAPQKGLGKEGLCC